MGRKKEEENDGEKIQMVQAKKITKEKPTIFRISQSHKEKIVEFIKEDYE